MIEFCRECDMALRSPTEYHPYAACLMFKACHDGDTVRANLDAVRTSSAPGAPGQEAAAVQAVVSALRQIIEADDAGCLTQKLIDIGRAALPAGAGSITLKGAP